jgi:hypothetical protein
MAEAPYNSARAALRQLTSGVQGMPPSGDDGSYRLRPRREPANPAEPVALLNIRGGRGRDQLRTRSTRRQHNQGYEAACAVATMRRTTMDTMLHIRGRATFWAQASWRGA